MYKNLLDLLIKFHNNDKSDEAFNKLIHPYKPEYPVLIINNNSNIEIYRIDIDKFSTKTNDFNMINAWMDSLNADTLKFGKDILNEQFVTDGFTLKSCTYCYNSFATISDCGQMLLCEECNKLFRTMEYGIVNSRYPIKFMFSEIMFGYRILNFCWFSIDKYSLNFWYTYDTNNERIQIKFCEKLSTYPSHLGIKFDYSNNCGFKCKICGCSIFRQDNGQMIAVLCNKCLKIFKERLKIKIVPIIQCLYHIDYIDDDIRFCIKKHLI